METCTLPTSAIQSGDTQVRPGHAVQHAILPLESAEKSPLQWALGSGPRLPPPRAGHCCWLIDLGQRESLAQGHTSLSKCSLRLITSRCWGPKARTPCLKWDNSKG